MSDSSLQRQLTSRSGVLGVPRLLVLRLLHLTEKVNCPLVSIICFLLSIWSNPILTFPLLFLPDEPTLMHGMDNHPTVRASPFYHLLPTGWAVVQNCTRPQCYYCFDQMSRTGTEVSVFPRNQTQFLRTREKNVNGFVNHYLKNCKLPIWFTWWWHLLRVNPSTPLTFWGSTGWLLCRPLGELCHAGRLGDSQRCPESQLLLELGAGCWFIHDCK